MTETSTKLALAESVREVLEKMFFADVTGGEEPTAPVGVAAQIVFEGDPPGSFRLDLDLVAARSVAADFLGEDPADLTATQMHYVVCELANMICGSVLSRIEGSATFRLGSPQIGGPSTACPAALAEAAFQAGVGGGALRAVIRTERPVCPEIRESGY